MAAGKERYFKNVMLMGTSPSMKEGYGTMFLLGNGMMYYYDYVVPVNGENRDQFMIDVLTHYTQLDGIMRISFVFASNIIHSLSQIVYPKFLGMDKELEPLEEDLAAAQQGGEEPPEGEGAAEEAYADEDAGASSPGTVTPLAGTENVTHEAIGSVEAIADTPIPFELWLFSIKKLGQNFAAASQNYERLSDEEKEALQNEYNATFGF